MKQAERLPKRVKVRFQMGRHVWYSKCETVNASHKRRKKR